MRESLDRLRLEVGELRASRKRLVVAADADRRKIERELHDGPQQELVAVAVKLQLVSRLVQDDPTAATALLDEMRREVREALDGTRALANRIYPPLLEAGGLGVALRSAAASIGVSTRVDMAAGAYAPEVAGTVYFCCVEALERIGPGGARPSPSVKTRARSCSRLSKTAPAPKRCSPIGISPGYGTGWRRSVAGSPMVSESGHGTRVSGSLPLS